MKLVVVLLFSSLVLAQQSATTSAPCSPIAPENTGTITINCPGIPKEQAQKMLSLLNKMLAKGVNTDAVLTQILEKEDEIITNQKKQSEEISKVKGQRGPWLLDETIQQKMFDALHNVPKVPIVVETLTDLGQNFANGISEVFVQLQWPTSSQISRFGPGGIPIGIDCIGQQKLRTSMDQIETALQFINASIECRTVPPGQLDIHNRDSVVIIVGERP